MKTVKLNLFALILLVEAGCASQPKTPTTAQKSFSRQGTAATLATVPASKRLVWDYPEELLPLVKFRIWGTADFQNWETVEETDTTQTSVALGADHRFFKVESFWR